MGHGRRRWDRSGPPHCGQTDIDNRQTADAGAKMDKIGVRVCCGKACGEDGRRTLEALRQEFANLNAEGKFDVQPCGCLDLCGEGPVVQVLRPDGAVMATYNEAGRRKIVAIAKELVAKTGEKT